MKINAAPRRGEVWRVELDPVRGSEQAKTRPVVVMSGIGRPSMRLCVPVTHWQTAHARMTWCVPLSPSTQNGLKKSSTADASQLRALDLSRFLEKLGALSDEEMETIVAAVTLCLAPPGT